MKKRNAANTDKVTGNSVNIIRKYLNEKNLPVDFESLDDNSGSLIKMFLNNLSDV